jgi:hypothetical protein
MLMAFTYPQNLYECQEFALILFQILKLRYFLAFAYSSERVNNQTMNGINSANPQIVICANRVTSVMPIISSLPSGCSTTTDEGFRQKKKKYRIPGG